MLTNNLGSKLRKCSCLKFKYGQIDDASTGSKYASLTGTSMAAPVISSIAAQSLSILGASTGNFYQAQKAKAIMMSSGDMVQGLQVVSNARANAFQSVLASLKESAGNPGE
jgi:hypothetical protein